MRQLDLFGNVIETPAADKKKQPIAAEVAVAEVEETPEVEADDMGEMRVMLSLDDTEEQTEVIEEPVVEEESLLMPVAEEEEQMVMHEDELPEPIADELVEEVVVDEAPVPVQEEVVIKTTKSAVPKAKAEKPKPVQKRGRKSFKEMDAEVNLVEVPEDEVLFKKQYYPISEVAGWFKVNTSLLRFWENEFDVLKPRKNRKGDRLFRPEDVKNLQLIYHLLRERKYTIEGAKDYLKSHHKRAGMEMQLATTLQKFKGFLLDLKANLQ